MAEKKNTRIKQMLAEQVQDQRKVVNYLALLIAAFAFILYANSVYHDYVLDDFSVIKDNNITVLGTKALPTIFKTSYRYGYFNLDDGLYRPLSLAMFAIEWQISPDNPHLSHFVNILLYALTGFFLFKTLSRLLSKYALVIPFLISALFIAHPVHTEVVANIKSRDELLCFLLCIVALNRFVNYFETQKALSFVFGLVAFFMALLSKETAITMVAAFPLAFYFFKDIKTSKLFSLAAFMVAVTGLYLFIRSRVLNGHLTDTSISAVDNLLIAAPNAATSLATAIKIALMYLQVLLLPHPLIYDYSFDHIKQVTFASPVVILALIVFGFGSYYMITRFLKKDLIAYGILFYVVTYSLFSNILFKIGMAMADRFIYFSSLGFCLILVALVARFYKLKEGEGRAYESISDFFRYNSKILIPFALVLFMYSVKTIARNADWKDNYTLYSHDVNLAPNSTRAHYYLGNWIIKEVAQKETDPAKRAELNRQGIAELEKALAIYPDYADALSQIGVGYYRNNELDKAADYFQRALKYNPNDVITLNNLAAIYFTKGKVNESIEVYNRIITINPRYSDALLNLANCYGMVKEYDKAIAYFLKTLEITPNNAKALYFLSITYGFKGDKALAQRYYDAAVAIDPSLRSQPH